MRPVKRGDIARLSELLSDLAGKSLDRRSTANRVRMVARDPGQELLVACAEGRVIGLMAFRIRENLEQLSRYGEVASIIVDTKWRTYGVGSKLIDAAEQLARRNKCIGLWLVSGFGREVEAHKFYRRLGFKKTGIRFVRPLTGG